MKIIKTLKNIFSSTQVKEELREEKSYTFPEALLAARHPFADQAEHLYRQTEDAGNFALQLAKLAKEAYVQEPLWAIDAMKAAMDLSPRDNYQKWLGFRLFDHGSIRESHIILSSLPEAVFHSASERNKWNYLRGCLALLDKNLPIPECEKPVVPQSRRLLYVASSSIVYQTTEDTIRTHELLKELIRQGIDVLCVTQPGYPFERNDASVTTQEESIVDGVRYRVLDGPHHRKTPLKEYLEQSSQILEKAIRDFAPVIVQAASNYEAGLPALLAARLCGVPFAYEVRSFEEYTEAARIPGFEGSERFELDKKLETFTAVSSDAVFTLNALISEGLKNRGIDEKKIHLLSNAITLDEIHRIVRESSLRTQLDGSLLPKAANASTPPPPSPVPRPDAPCHIVIAGQELADGLSASCQKQSGVSCFGTSTGNALAWNLGEGRRAYLAFDKRYDGAELPVSFKMSLPYEGGSELIGCITFFAADVQKISYAFFRKKPVIIAKPENTAFIKLSVRIAQKGQAENISIVFDGATDSTADVANAALPFSAPPTVHDESGQNDILRQPRPIDSLPLCRTCAEKAGQGGEAFAAWMKTVKVACIMDDFTWNSYSPEAQMLQLTPENWRQELESFGPDLVFVESAWRGKDELWKNVVHKNPDALLGILRWCRVHDVPSVFWNKEDPIHFDTFISTAVLFDAVFTYDFNCVERYKAYVGHERVFYLPMAVPPRLFNPIEKYERKDAFCFAGSYYVRYPERTRDLEDYCETLPQYKPLEIYDRQYGKDDPNYMFPDKYKPLIQGYLPYDQMDRAYKGYNFAINLNSIKQAQSVARRVFELLASNTLTVSNFSKGVRTLFGDLVITSDSGRELVRRLSELSAIPNGLDRLRLAGLRKVFEENCYQDRLAYVLCALAGAKKPSFLPKVVVLGHAHTADEAATLCQSFVRQDYPRKHMFLIVDDAVPEVYDTSGVQDIILVRAENWDFKALLHMSDVWVAIMSPADFYGPSYLLDLALATRYTAAQVIGKRAYYASDGEAVALFSVVRPYCMTSSLPSHRSLAHISAFARCLDMSKPALPQKYTGIDALVIDPFNYCSNGAQAPSALMTQIVDLPALDQGLSVSALQKIAQNTPALTLTMQGPAFRGQSLLEVFSPSSSGGMVTAELLPAGQVRYTSCLPEGKHVYLWSKKPYVLRDLPSEEGIIKLHLQTSGGLPVSLGYQFADAESKKLSGGAPRANSNISLTIPENAALLRLGLRVSNVGSVDVEALHFGHLELEPTILRTKNKYLILTNHYPSYTDLYRNGFVHSRVRAYLRQGMKCDVFEFNQGVTATFREFENIDVIRGSANALRKMLDQNQFSCLIVHFLDRYMWNVLKDYAGCLPILVWLHGSEIHPWHRRKWNFTTPEELEKAQAQSVAREAFWHELFADLPPQMHFVFVSRTFAQQVFEDYGIVLPPDSYSIIHNPIDTAIFAYHAKDAAQRYSILSIRPFTSRIYANDLSVMALKKLSERPDFDKFNIRIIGQGKYFVEAREALGGYSNIALEERFLTQREIAWYHRDYGIFLSPTRCDSQGVSRDEAMASGLVPVTNAVAAISEFVDDSCGILAPAEDADAMAAGIGRLADDPDLFASMSKAAAERVRRQSGSDIIIEKELALITGRSA